MSAMNIYMRRWHNLSACHIRNIHAESFLKSFLDRFGVNAQLVKNLSYVQKPHGSGQCH